MGRLIVSIVIKLKTNPFIFAAGKWIFFRETHVFLPAVTNGHCGPKFRSHVNHRRENSLDDDCDRYCVARTAGTFIYEHSSPPRAFFANVLLMGQPCPQLEETGNGGLSGFLRNTRYGSGIGQSVSKDSTRIQ